MARPLFQINPSIDRIAAKVRFVAQGRAQIPAVLTEETALAIHHVLSQQTPWGLAWQAGEDGPTDWRADQLAELSPERRAELGRKSAQAMQAGKYAFQYARYPMLDAYLDKRAEGSPHDLLIEHINAEPFLDLIRDVTAMPELVKADAQATLYGPGHFLSQHDDSHVAEGWKIAYVLNLCREEWRPDWGGYLNFYDAQGEVESGYKPRFNTLNLFRVPQPHSVSFVPPFAPVGRFAISGWFRDR